MDGNLVTAPAWPAHPKWLAAFVDVLGYKVRRGPGGMRAPLVGNCLVPASVVCMAASRSNPAGVATARLSTKQGPARACCPPCPPSWPPPALPTVPQVVHKEGHSPRAPFVPAHS